MRTTVTLDPDVERLLRNNMKQQGISFKEALNQAVRGSLAQSSGRRRRRFVQKTFPMGAEQYFRWDKALAIAEGMQDEELTRKLSIQK